MNGHQAFGPEFAVNGEAVPITERFVTVVQVPVLIGFLRCASVPRQVFVTLSRQVTNPPATLSLD